MQSKSIPSLPTCFDKSVNIRIHDDSYKKIYDVKPGDILYDNNKVYAIMKLSMTNDQSIFYLNNDLVTSYHHVELFTNNHTKWVYVKDHPDSIERNLYRPNNVYCLHTQNKNINTLFNKYLDWEDTDTQNTSNLKIEGYRWDTFVVTVNETLKCICKIKIGDILYLGCEVIGIVLIHKQDETYITEQSIWEKNVDEYKCIYNFHLITTMGDFYIFDNQTTKKVFDYSEYTS